MVDVRTTGDDHPEPSYAMRVVMARCGDEIADQVLGIEIFEQVLALIQALEDRVAELTKRVEAKRAA
jgi:hypothetical protein